MNVDTMRSIDRRAGVPLCAVASVLVRLRNLIRGRASRPVRRVLFVELSEMGTTVLAEPAMRKAREQLSAELFFVISTQNPVEFHGTYPLPEAQMDRFMLQFSPGYVSPEVEVQIAKAISLQIAVVLGQPPPGVNPDHTLLTLDWRFLTKWSLATTVGDAGTTIFDLLWQRRY